MPEPDLSLFTRDGVHRLLAWLHIEKPHRPDLVRRAVYSSLVTWFPLLLLTAAEGNLLRLVPQASSGVPGPTGWFDPRQSFLMDLSAVAQFLGFFPFAFFAEGFIDSKIQAALVRLRSVAADAELEAVSRWAGRWGRTIGADAVIIPIAYAATWSWASQEIANGLDSWHTIVAPGGERFTLAGYYVVWFALPLFTYVWLRWVWKVIVWTSFLARVSRMRLNVHAAHPDRTGGLGCLSDVQTSFAVILFGTGVLFSAAMVHKLFFERTPIGSLDVWGPLVVYVLLAPAVFLGPLFLFTSTLGRAKREALAAYGEMATALVTRFERRWMRGVVRAPAELLQSPEPSALADFKIAFDTVQEMRVVPFDRRSFLELFSAAATPFAPIAFFTKLPEKVTQLLDLFG